MRISKQDLAETAESLTHVARSVGVIRKDEHFALNAAYGGYKIALTGGPIIGSGISSGRVGLSANYLSRTETWLRANAALRALEEVEMARNV